MAEIARIVRYAFWIMDKSYVNLWGVVLIFIVGLGVGSSCRANP